MALPPLPRLSVLDSLVLLADEMGDKGPDTPAGPLAGSSPRSTISGVPASMHSLVTRLCLLSTQGREVALREVVCPGLD